ncbi:DNA/RNA nuclease SfsA [Colidextribacter sp. OB.20]|uniref:DNA/RNA nuclease SfsA n=1 Tax=Colidextribacter sp. OB.20 TaxID=2304568 RepID=UPI00136E9EC4|nr:DNA/RNA nuclease SfsA [Colidextribacter sp. OB.20]NBI10872.1 DNA/RNA nuclease SfsA [Colidextribacter sp. OB.20]
MVYGKILPGIFQARPNRFIAHVEIEGQTEVCHVKNTGRCRELLLPGAKVWLEESANPARKTRYDLIAVEKVRPSGTLLINMDSQAPNRVFGEWAAGGGLGFVPELLRPETVYGGSRFDFYWEASARRGFWEVKGVTLEEDNTARFPDAPTLRGVKHLEELAGAREAGYEAGVCFVVQMAGMDHVEPNDTTHPEFGAALRRAAERGVEVLALECAVEPGRLAVRRKLPVVLERGKVFPVSADI